MHVLSQVWCWQILKSRCPKWRLSIPFSSDFPSATLTDTILSPFRVQCDSKTTKTHRHTVPCPPLWIAHPGDLNEFAIYGGHPSCPMGKRQNIYMYCELLFRNVLRNSVSLYGTPRNFINMGCCRGRNILLFILVLQMVSILSYKFGIRSACFAIWGY